MRTFIPADLQSLFGAFDLLEQGTSVCLTSSESIIQDRESRISDTLCDSSAPHLGLFSSGSTGTPKLCWWSWAQLKSEVRVGTGNPNWRWASPFAPCTFAGVQVALQVWATSKRVISLGPAAWDKWEFLSAEDVQGLSCTPTFLDMLLQQAPSLSQAWRPKQITLGGEPLRPAAGMRFRRAFPEARFTIIYASAEVGVLLKTHRLDGYYELRSLEKRFPQWRLADRQLQVWKEEAWRSTGDLVEVTDDLLRVIGRADRVANVAGAKISLDEVTSLAEQVPGVQAAQAIAAPSSVCGQIVVLRFSPETGFASHEVQARLKLYLRERLRKEAWPRRWEVGLAGIGSNAKRAIS